MLCFSYQELSDTSSTKHATIELQMKMVVDAQIEVITLKWLSFQKSDPSLKSGDNAVLFMINESIKQFQNDNWLDW